MRPLVLATLLGSACTNGDGGGNDTGNTTDTGVADCPVEVHLDALACLESTIPVTVPTGSSGYGGGNVTGTVTGTVSEVGAPSTQAGSVAVGGFAPCDEAERIVRIDDGAGGIWTVGWAVTGETDQLPDSLTVGAAVTLDYNWRFTGYDVSQGLVISDSVGPRFVFAGAGGVDPALLDGLTVTYLSSDSCIVELDGNEWEETPLEFAAENTLLLFSGQTGTVEFPNHSLEVVVPQSAWLTDCADGCGTNEWVGWD